MINYIWMFLIAVAVGLAAFFDLTGQKPTVPRDPVLLASFEPDAGETATGMGLKAVDAKPIGDATSNRAGELPFKLGEGQTVTVQVPAQLAIPFAPANPSAIELRLLLEEEGTGGAFVEPESDKVIVRALFVNADGERLVGDVSARPGAAAGWVKGKVVIADLKPLAENPLAKISWPVLLTGFSITRPAESTLTGGRLLIDDVKALMPPNVLAGSAPEAESWMAVVTKSAATRAEDAIKLAIGLIGIMMLWLGLMRIAEQAGLVKMLAAGVKPIMVRLFPDIPGDSAAMGAIIMNVAANMLGLGNAATPLGLKAMEEMQKENPYPAYASNAMCMLLAINTSSVTVIPSSVIAYRAAQGSVNIMAFWPLMMGATLASTVVAVIACKVLERLPIYAIPADAAGRDAAEAAAPKATH